MTVDPPAEPNPLDAGGRDLAKWQAQMATLMSGMVLGLTIFFAIVAIIKFGPVQAAVIGEPLPVTTQAWHRQISPTNNGSSELTMALNEAAFDLESRAIFERYRQVTIAQDIRLWTRFMGFLTGMSRDAHHVEGFS
jgi:hypothetical protein